MSKQRLGVLVRQPAHFPIDFLEGESFAFPLPTVASLPASPSRTPSCDQGGHPPWNPRCFASQTSKLASTPLFPRVWGSGRRNPYEERAGTVSRQQGEKSERRIEPVFRAGRNRAWFRCHCPKPSAQSSTDFLTNTARLGEKSGKSSRDLFIQPLRLGQQDVVPPDGISGKLNPLCSLRPKAAGHRRTKKIFNHFSSQIPRPG
jgi:hypothetical protein